MCASMKKKACRKSATCQWSGACAVAADPCAAVQRRRGRRKLCEATAATPPPAASYSSNAQAAAMCVCSNSGRRSGACGACKAPASTTPTPTTPTPAPVPKEPAAPAGFARAAKCGAFTKFEGAGFDVRPTSTVVLYVSKAAATPAPTSPVPVPVDGDSGDDSEDEGMPYDSGDDDANEGMPYPRPYGPSPSPSPSPSPYGYGMAPSAGTVAHALILPKGGDGALAKVVAHAHVKPCAQEKGDGHWMHDATKAKSDTSNKLYILGPVGRWYKTMAAWKVNSGSAISGVQENRPRSIVVHDPDTMAKALCCDLAWEITSGDLGNQGD